MINTTSDAPRLLPVRRGVGLAALAAALAVALPAAAQETAEAADAGSAPASEGDPIVVTGSRIARSGFTRADPGYRRRRRADRPPGCVEHRTGAQRDPRVPPAEHARDHGDLRQQSRRVYGRPSRPRRQSHAGADRRPPGCRLDGGGRLVHAGQHRGPQPGAVIAARAGRGRNRRRIRRLRLRRCGRCHQPDYQPQSRRIALDAAVRRV